MFGRLYSSLTRMWTELSTLGLVLTRSRNCCLTSPIHRLFFPLTFTIGKVLGGAVDITVDE